MPWTDALDYVVPAVIGAGSALGVQWWNSRQSSANSHADREAAKRRDLREAIYAFIEAVQSVEQFADPANDSSIGLLGIHGSIVRNLTAEAAQRVERNAVLHKMWFRQRALQVIATEELTNRSLALTIAMRDVLFNNIPGDIDMWQHLDRPRSDFLETARTALYAESA